MPRQLAAARKRLGSAQTTLAWFLRFAEEDLKKLSPSEISIASYNLLGATPIDFLDWPRDAPVQPMNLNMLRKIQNTIKSAIETVFCLKEPPNSRHVWADWQMPGPEIVGIKRFGAIGAEDLVFEVYNKTNQRIRYVVYGFLGALALGGKYLRTCKRCGKPFVRFMRQEYCGTECSQITRNETKQIAKKNRMKK